MSGADFGAATMARNASIPLPFFPHFETQATAASTQERIAKIYPQMMAKMHTKLRLSRVTQIAVRDRRLD